MSNAVPYIAVGISALGTYMGYRADKKAGKIAAQQATATGDYYTGIADRLSAAPVQPFIAPFIPNNNYLFQAEVTEKEGEYLLERGKWEEAQFDVNAGQVRAASQRHAIAERDLGDAVYGDAIAEVTGGGGLPQDIAEILAEVDAVADYNMLSRLYEGESEAVKMEFQGDVAAYEGELAHVASIYNGHMIRAEGAYANELGQRQNLMAQYEYQRYISDRNLQIASLYDQADLAYEGVGAALSVSNNQATATALQGLGNIAGNWPRSQPKTTDTTTTLGSRGFNSNYADRPRAVPMR